MLIDTHCHIHEESFPLDPEEALVRAEEVGVGKVICVGTGELSSLAALEFAAEHEEAFASIGIHPHDTKDGWGMIAKLADGKSEKLVAVGEIGLDYFYMHSPRETQIVALESQIQTALDHNLAIIFHVRDAASANRRTSVWSDFWPILDNFSGIRGELHSFTDNQANLDQGLKRGLYIGVNGISTFTKDEAQQKLFASIPLDRLLLETDAPFLTPVPMRGKINEPAFVTYVAAAHAAARDKTPEEIASVTTANATVLFGL